MTEFLRSRPCPQCQAYFQQPGIDLLRCPFCGWDSREPSRASRRDRMGEFGPSYVRALGGLFALALAVILAACGGGGSKTGGNPAATQSCNVTLSQLKQHPTLATRIEQ